MTPAPTKNASTPARADALRRGLAVGPRVLALVDRPNFLPVRRRLPYSTQADYRTSCTEFEVEGSPIARVKLPQTRRCDALAG